MNKERRKEIRSIMGQLEALKWRIDEVRDEEQEYFDAMPENFQDSERGQTAEEVIGYLDDAANTLEEAISNLDEAQQ